MSSSSKDWISSLLKAPAKGCLPGAVRPPASGFRWILLKQTVRSTAKRFSPFGSIFTISDEYPGSGGGLWRRAFLHSSRRCDTYRRAGGRRFCTGTGDFRIHAPGFCHRGTGWRCIRTWFCRCLLHSFHGAGIFCRFL